MNYLRYITLVFCCLTLSCKAQQKAQETISDETPNLLLIITDEHNFRTLGCYRTLMSDDQAYMWGKAVVETPNIDFLAENGAILTSMYASSPVCTPSRSSMFTGNYPQTNNMPNNNTYLSAKIPTIADIAVQNGYTTSYVGKWHLAGADKPGWSPEYNFGFQDNRYMFNRGHWKKFGMEADGTPYVAAKNKKGKLSSSVSSADEESFATDFLTNRAMEFMRKNKEKPFFTVISYPDPHTPNTVRAPYDTMYTGEEFELPRTYRKTTPTGMPNWRKTSFEGEKKNISDEKILQDLPQYYGMVKCLDDNIGRIISQLKADGILENTIIVFSSDHGDLFGEHGRVNKGTPHETSAKIPFIVYYPKAIQAKTVVNQAANTTDWMDTFLQMMHVQNYDTSTTEGRDISSWFLKDATTNPNLQDITFVRMGFWVAAVTDRYKLILDRNDNEPWLIDLEKDADENTNFIKDAAYAEIVKELAKALLDYGVKYDDKTVLNKVVQGRLEKLM